MECLQCSQYDNKKNLPQTIALIGNPNVGKTTIFNSLTGSRHEVGNWPGVTIEKKEGTLLFNKERIRVVDLPGIYSLGASSEDELVSRKYILEENPDVLIDVVDASSLIRNMYLTVQLLELEINLVIALNMVDEASEKQVFVKPAELSKVLGVPVVETVATKNMGIRELVAATSQLRGNQRRQPFSINYGSEVEAMIDKLENLLITTAYKKEELKYPSRWLAVKMVEGDKEVLVSVGNICSEHILAYRDEVVRQWEESTGKKIELHMIEKRYEYINSVIENCVQIENGQNSITLSDKIDTVVLNKYMGVPLFFAVMWVVFKFTFTFSAPLVELIDNFFVVLGQLVGSLIKTPLLSSLVNDGIISGLGSILVFIPNIFFLFLAISILEDSGYLVRAAYVMDRFMRVFGLQGKAFIPLLIGFGCSVPAIMATRTIEDEKERLTTLLITPLMSCSARMPVYVLFVSAFFKEYRSLVLFSIYLLGIMLAVLMAKLFKSKLFPGETVPFLMEMPPYRVPTLKSVFLHVWERLSSFIKKAGTVILGVVVLVWALSSLPWGVEYASQASLMGKVGTFLAPAFAPLGFGTWEAASALLYGLVAKEVIVSTLGVLYGAGDEGLILTISQMWTPLAAYSFMAMTLIYIPCVAVLGTIKKETGSWKWMLFSAGYTLILGWLVSFIIYQGGLLLGLG